MIERIINLTLTGHDDEWTEGGKEVGGGRW